jgi:exodeoxyribonuclease VII small subunit
MANTSYQKAYDELQSIVTKLQNDEIGLDDLSKSVKRAGVLIHSCKEKLRNVELEIDELFDKE